MPVQVYKEHESGFKCSYILQANIRPQSRMAALMQTRCHEVNIIHILLFSMLTVIVFLTVLTRLLS